MTITFTGPESSAIEAVEVDADAGDQNVIFRYKYYKLTAEQGNLGVRRNAPLPQPARLGISNN